MKNLQLLNKMDLLKDGFQYRVAFVNPTQLIVTQDLYNGSISNAKLHLVDLSKMQISEKFADENRSFIKDLHALSNGVITWVEMSLDLSSVFQTIENCTLKRGNINSNKVETLLATQSIEYPPAQALFREQCKQAITAFLPLPDGYAVALEDGNIRFYSDNNELIRVCKLVFSNSSSETDKNLALYWDPYKGSIIVKPGCGREMVEINLNYKQKYHEALTGFFPPVLELLMEGYLQLDNKPKSECKESATKLSR